MDEGERIAFVEEYHRNARISVPNEFLHATLHATIETQVAMGEDLPALRTLSRLMREGLDRHDAIHAMGSVLAEHMFDVMKREPMKDPNRSYFAALERLTAAAWKQSAR